MTRRRLIIGAIVLVAIVLILVQTCNPKPSPRQATGLPIFPGAEGYASQMKGAYGCGTNPVVLRVTKLTDDYSGGTLREATDDTRPRVVVFEISGNIILQTDINITNPCIQVAGQTAPSPGITVRGSTTATSASGGIMVLTHDVLLQHFRIRPGDTPPTQPETYGHDATIAYNGGVYNVFYDHMSLSWAGDKNALSGSLDLNGEVNYWRCFITEALFHASNVTTTPTDPSSLGMLIKQSYVGWYANTAVMGSLFAHNADRNPEIQGPDRIQFINNVVYDWGTDDQTGYPWGTFIYSENVEDGPLINLIGNQYIAGPGYMPNGLYAVGTWNLPTNTQLYMNDNALDTTTQAADLFYLHGFDPRVGTPPLSLSGITVRASSATKAFVLANAGARPMDRDAVDTRLVSEVTNRTGGRISSQSEVGGWPTLAVNTRTLTTPSNLHGDDDGDGYTNLEEWLQSYKQAVEETPADVTPIAPATGSPTVNDTFTGTAGTALPAHVGELGATWTNVAGTSNTAVLSNANRLRNNVLDLSLPSVYYASGVPLSADYDLCTSLRSITTIPNNNVMLWIRATVTFSDGIALQILNGQLNLFEVVANNYTVKQSTAYSFADNTSNTVCVQARGTFAGARVGSTPVLYEPGPLVVTSAGRIGVSMWDQGVATTNTTGYHVDSVTATDVLTGAAGPDHHRRGAVTTLGQR